MFVSIFILLSHYPGNSYWKALTKQEIRKDFREGKKTILLYSDPIFYYFLFGTVKQENTQVMADQLLAFGEKKKLKIRSTEREN